MGNTAKNLIFIGGTMGVGKTAVGQKLKKRLNKCVYLDGDWCWDMQPFVVNEETKLMVLDNISHLLCSFLDCTEFENIVFTWVMHEQDIIDTLLSRLGDREYRFFNYSLVCAPAVLEGRLMRDVQSGLRAADVIERSLPRLPLYDKINSVKINTDTLTAEEVADRIANYIYS